MKPLLKIVVTIVFLAGYFFLCSFSEVEAKTSSKKLIEKTVSASEKAASKDTQVLIAQESSNQSAAPVSVDSNQTNEVLGESDSYNTTGETGRKRVNNLKNLEALMNIIANLIEIGGFLIAPMIFITGVVLVFKKDKKVIGIALIGFSFAFLVTCMAVPGVFHWFIESARDANQYYDQ